MARYDRGILVTSGGSFLGDHIAAALLSKGAEVSLLTRPGGTDLLGPLAQHARWSTADVWNPASLHGKARYHSVVIHAIGSMNADPTRGHSFHQLNVISLRNVANMCVSDGVARLIYISCAAAPWINRAYLRSKRDAEGYLRRIGLNATIIRAPLIYVRGQPRPLFYRLITAVGANPPLSWLPLNRAAPMPIDVFARGVASIALSAEHDKSVYYSRDLRRRNSREELRDHGETISYLLPPRSQATEPIQTIQDVDAAGWPSADA